MSSPLWTRLVDLLATFTTPRENIRALDGGCLLGGDLGAECPVVRPRVGKLVLGACLVNHRAIRDVLGRFSHVWFRLILPFATIGVSRCLVSYDMVVVGKNVLGCYTW